MAHVLVVDDDADIRFFARVNLEAGGHEVGEAASADDAWTAIAADPPDVLVLDIMMPGTDGFTLLERLKRADDEDVRTVPVVMLTALGGTEDRLRGGIEGAVRYLVKPVDPDDLVGAVDHALAGGPEPVQRRRAQAAALEQLARREAGRTAGTRPEPRLSRLERPPSPRRREPSDDVRARLASLTDRQRRLLDALHTGPTVADVAADLGVSRSNVYASLRRIGRRLEIDDVPELLRRIRAGDLQPE